jgi:hypothetical protein
MFGSWGRRELTSRSDDDWVVLVDGDERDNVVPAVSDVRAHLDGEERAPGSQDVFGGNVFCDHLVGRIGLDADDNKNLTRRVLLTLESVALTNEHVWQDCRERVLVGYLDESVKPKSPPRFLLNDLVRYWRTICVDFVGKERENGVGEKWALRNAKLRTGRKMLFASGLLPVLMCHRHDEAGIREFLSEQFDAYATDRVAAAFLAYGAIDAGLRTFGAYDRWLGILGDTDLRKELQSLARSDAPSSALFQDVYEISRQLEQGLLTLLFDTDLYVPVRDFGIF